MLALDTFAETIVGRRGRYPGDEICDGTAPCLSILVVAGLLPRCGQVVYKTSVLLHRQCAPRAQLLLILRYASMSPWLHFRQQLYTKKCFPSCQARHRCWCRLRSRTRSFEGALAIPETIFATVRHHASPFLSSPVCYPAEARW